MPYVPTTTKTSDQYYMQYYDNSISNIRERKQTKFGAKYVFFCFFFGTYSTAFFSVLLLLLLLIIFFSFLIFNLKNVCMNIYICDSILNFILHILSFYFFAFRNRRYFPPPPPKTRGVPPKYQNKWLHKKYHCNISKYRITDKSKIASPCQKLAQHKNMPPTK